MAGCLTDSEERRAGSVRAFPARDGMAAVKRNMMRYLTAGAAALLLAAAGLVGTQAPAHR
jgi:hypothetical protein